MIQEKSRKKKVIFVITKSNWGGAQRYVYDLATTLPRDRYEVAVACGGEGALVDKLRIAGIRTLMIPDLGRDISITKDLAVFAQLLNLFRTEQPDIVHLNSSKIGGIGAFAGRIAHVPHIIFTAHGWAFNEDRPAWQKWMIKFFTWLTIVLARTTIAVSQGTLDQIRHFPFVRKKIALIHNGIPSTPLLPRAEAREIILPEEQHSSIPGHALWIGVVAELHKTKGLTYALQAIEILKKTRPDIALIFIVIGEGAERVTLERLIETLELTGHVFLVGHKQNAAELLSGFDIFMLPSISEALGYVLLEAGAAGLPVVATRVGGIPEIIEDGVSGILVAPRSPEAIAAAITVLINDPAKAPAYGAALKKKVGEQFSLERMLAKTESVYTEQWISPSVF